MARTDEKLIEIGDVFTESFAKFFMPEFKGDKPRTKATEKELLVIGKWRVIALHYCKVKCYMCNTFENPICKYCKENKLENKDSWIYGLSDEEIEKLYKEIEENE